MNWETIIIAAFIAVPATITSIATLVVGIRTGRAVNGMVGKRVEAESRVATAEATLAEKDAQMGRDAEGAKAQDRRSGD